MRRVLDRYDKHFINPRETHEIIRIWTKRAWNYALISLVTVWLHILRGERREARVQSRIVPIVIRREEGLPPIYVIFFLFLFSNCTYFFMRSIATPYHYTTLWQNLIFPGRYIRQDLFDKRSRQQASEAKDVNHSSECRSSLQLQNQISSPWNSQPGITGRFRWYLNKKITITQTKWKRSSSYKDVILRGLCN